MKKRNNLKSLIKPGKVGLDGETSEGLSAGLATS